MLRVAVENYLIWLCVCVFVCVCVLGSIKKEQAFLLQECVT